MKSFLSFLTEDQQKPKRSGSKNVMQHENTAISDMNSAINAAKGKDDHVKIKVNGKIHHITHAEKVPGTPKADFMLHDKSGNHVYLSHKAGSSVKDFQQFGGTTSEGSHPAVQKVVKHIKKHYGGEGSKMPGTVATKLDRTNPEHEALLHRAAFGSEHGSPKHGINNVHAIVQGKLGLKSADGHHEITATHTYSNKGGKGKLPSHVGGMVSARYMGGRKNHGLNNVRTGVLPIGSRAVAEHV